MAVPSLTAVTLPPSTAATSGLSLVHVTSLFVAPSGLTVAVRVALFPAFSSRLFLSSVTLSTATSAFATVTVQVAVLSPAFAVMVAVPSAFAVTVPPSTVAISGLSLVHVTVLSVALSGFTVAVRVAVFPAFSSRVVWFSSTLCTGTVAGCPLTVTLQLALLPSAVAVMVAVPAALAVTLPLLSTSTISGLSLFQVTVLLVASSGFTVAVRVALSFTSSVRSVLSSVTLVTPIFTPGSIVTLPDFSSMRP